MIPSALCGLVCTVSAALAGAAEPVALGSRLELLVDDIDAPGGLLAQDAPPGRT